MIKINAPKSHPRYLSNFYRDLMADGVKKGVTSLQGLIAHGRGETFDYLFGEKTHEFAHKAIETAAAMFLLSEHPVLSVNGNTAVLVPKETIELARLISAKIEVNLFHGAKSREKKIVAYLKKLGANEVLLPDETILAGIKSNRRMISSFGQAKADVVFVPLEDGDRTMALVHMGKKVITVDLNPLSRTAQTANVTIVDNIVRVMPLLIKKVRQLTQSPSDCLTQIVENYDNSKILAQALTSINFSHR